jgi:hypothetical protein
VLRKQLFAFLSVVACGTLLVNGLNAHDARITGSSPRVKLAAQAAEIPVPRPLPVDASKVQSDLGAVSGADTVIAPAPAEFSGPAPARVAPPQKISQVAKAAAPGESGTWAVVIGINDYPGDSNDLHYAVNDANDVVTALTQQGAGDHILFLQDGQVTPEVIHSSIDWLNSHAGPDAVAVFFYSGHGAKRNGGEALVASDGRFVTDQQLGNWFRPLRAHKAWITIAACYGGGFTEVLAPGRVLTGAAPANSVAYENSGFKRSYLGEYMIRRAMIGKAADATVETAFNYARDEISQDSPGREPVQFDYSDGHVDLRPPGSTESSAGSTPPPSGTPSQPAPPPPSDQAPPPPDPGDNGTPPPPKQCKGLIKIC